jgi:hypothetical protein
MQVCVTLKVSGNDQFVIQILCYAYLFVWRISDTDDAFVTGSATVIRYWWGEGIVLSRTS